MCSSKWTVQVPWLRINLVLWKFFIHVAVGYMVWSTEIVEPLDTVLLHLTHELSRIRIVANTYNVLKGWDQCHIYLSVNY